MVLIEDGRWAVWIIFEFSSFRINPLPTDYFFFELTDQLHILAREE